MRPPWYPYHTGGVFLFVNLVGMEKIDGSMVSSYGDGTREDFLFTYSDEEKEQHDLDRLNASLILNPEFIPVYPKMLQDGYSLIEATVY